MPSTAEIDKAILSVASAHWQKVVMIIAKASGAREDATPSDDQAVADRIEVLIEQGKLECEGDPKRWRYSEVRIAQ